MSIYCWEIWQRFRHDSTMSPYFLTYFEARSGCRPNWAHPADSQVIRRGLFTRFCITVIRPEVRFLSQ